MTGSAALVVAAGRGSRLGGGVPKQYRPLAGLPMLRHSLETLAAHPAVGPVRVVIHPDDRDLYDRATRGLELLDPVGGGTSRQDSVRLGLQSLRGLAPEQVLIHDAARPHLSATLVDRILAALPGADGVIPAVPVVDSLKRCAAGGMIVADVDRRDLWRAQTPQAFRYAAILAAHEAAGPEAQTDDAAVARAAGLEVRIVDGEDRNVKITTDADLAPPPAAPEVRVGQGFDVHRFGPGSAVRLCGVTLPHTAALLGHSDGDVALHAVTDAILGGLGAGDIGEHFPPSDERWRDADSAQFVRHAQGLLAARGGRIEHLDLTLICEAPRIGPHRDAMRAALSDLLGVARDRVSVKATTTERLGFTGRGEGIAALAVATLALGPA